MRFLLDMGPRTASAPATLLLPALAAAALVACEVRRRTPEERPAAPPDVSAPAPVTSPERLALRTPRTSRQVRKTPAATRPAARPAGPSVAPSNVPSIVPSMLEKVIELNAVQEPELDRDALRSAFREVVERARAGTAKAEGARAKIAALNRVLLADRKVGYLSNKYWRDSTLAASVLRKKGNCLSTSTLYVLIGEQLGLPLRLVIVPGHAFVRWDDGETRVNIETTDGGREVPDDKYFETRPCTPADRARLGWGKSQDADGFLAHMLRVAAGHLRGENRLAEALLLLDRALALKPRRPDVKLRRMQLVADITADRKRFRREVVAMLRNDDPPPGVATNALVLLAVDFGGEGDHETERKMLMGAFAVAPKYEQQDVLQRLAFCHRALKDFRGAARYMELALALTPSGPDPKRPNLLYNLAILQKNDGRLKDALASIEEGRRLNPEAWSLKIIKAGYLVLDGRREEGLALFAKIRDEKPRGQEEFYNIMIAWFYAVSEQRASFYAAFERALAESSSTGVLNWIDQDVDLDVYREEPEFRALVARHRARLLGTEPPAGGSPEPEAGTRVRPAGQPTGAD